MWILPGEVTDVANRVQSCALKTILVSQDNRFLHLRSEAQDAPYIRAYVVSGDSTPRVTPGRCLIAVFWDREVENGELRYPIMRELVTLAMRMRGAT